MIFNGKSYFVTKLCAEFNRCISLAEILEKRIDNKIRKI